MDQLIINGEINTINFKTAGSGYYLISYKTELVDYKDGGVFADSKLSVGRTPVFRQESNYIDTMVFGIYGNSQDQVAERLQNLETECDTAFDYWPPGSVIANPVYLTAQLNNETNIRYAWIYKARLENVPNLYAGEFQSGILVEGTPYACGISNVTLVIERSAWLSHSPGNSDSVSITTYEDNLVYGAHVSGAYSACVQISNAEILGDLTALGKITLADPIDLTTRIIGGYRSTGRGANFTAYFNFPHASDGVYGTSIGSGGTTETDADSPTGSASQITWIPASNWDGSWNEAATVAILDLAQFRGRYRAFLRIKAMTGTDAKIGLRLLPPGFSVDPPVRNISTRFTAAADTVYTLDLGELSIPPSDQWSTPGVSGLLNINLRLYAYSTSGTVNFQELVIVPIDEYAFDITFPGNLNMLGNDVTIDSITMPRLTQALVTDNSTGYFHTIPRLVHGHSFVPLPLNRTFRIWFFAIGQEPHGMGATPSVSAIYRYKHLRGNT